MNSKTFSKFIVFTMSFAIIGAICYGVFAILQTDKNKAEHYFSRDKDDIIIVTEYLIKSEYESVSISSSNGSMYVGHTVNIEEDEVIKAINRLLNKDGYKRIEKCNNTINFLIWTRLMDYGSGIAYSVIDQDEPKLPHLTRFESLSEENWFYYEEDYNKWRNSN